ncbi:unnamed protein product [Clavelina lepadiformis]|uniref:Uncharacterized protein n=1 Tax=Clavelina lepadiformis TaxID=159417 RepID=A0ABP0F9Y7_CLALP
MILLQGRCVRCGRPGVSDAYYCKECTIQEKDVKKEMAVPKSSTLLEQEWIFFMKGRSLVLERDEQLI